VTSSASLTPARAFRIVGAVAIVLGGILAAVTGPLQLGKGSWAAAYLVLVAGAAQYVMGAALTRWRPAGSTTARWCWFALWNLGHLGVIGGTVAGSTATVFVGSGLLVIALVLAFLASLGTRVETDRTLLLGYRVLLVLLAVSIPVGMVLSAIRNA